MKTESSFGSDIGQVQQRADQNVEKVQREIRESLSIVAILFVVLFVVAAGTIWGAIVLQLIKLAYGGLIALMRWQSWLHH
jgi:hypothetical protein